MAEGETKSPGPKKCGPYISSVTSQSVNLMIRGVVLFFIGVFLALVLNLLQIQRNVTLFPPDVIASIFSSAWWVPPCCGTASVALVVYGSYLGQESNWSYIGSQCHSHGNPRSELHLRSMLHLVAMPDP